MTTNPLGLQVHDVSGYAPRHDVYDTDKRDRLAADMSANGWQGGPVVARVDFAQAITGSHRIPAAALTGISVPVVDIYDLAAATGIDLDEMVAEHGFLEDALPHFCAALPAEIRDAYGLDID